MSVSTTDTNTGPINDQVGRRLEAISAQVEANIERGRNAMAEWRVSASDRATQLGQQLDLYTHEKPWQMISWAFVGGIVLGLICGCGSLRRYDRY